MPPSGRQADRSARTSAGDLSRIGSKDRVRFAGASSGAPRLVPAGLALAAAVAAWLFWGRLASCGASLETPETQIRKALANQGRAHFGDAYGFRAGGTVELHSTRFEDIAPSIEEKGRAVVVAMLSAEGRVAWRDQDARLTYLGRERFHMKPCSFALWCGEGDQFDRLRGVLSVLFRRHDAMERRDLEAYGRLLSARYRDRGQDRAETERRLERELSGPPARIRVTAWQIRVERDGAEVGEDLEIAAPGQEPRRERHVYRLVRESERWVFAGGV